MKALAAAGVLATCAAAGAAGTVLLTSVAVDAASEPTMTASRAVVPGSPVIVRGAACTTGAEATVEVALRSAEGRDVATATATPRADGSWSASIPTTGALPVGTYRVVGDCDHYSAFFTYRAVAVTVRVAAAPTASTAPPETTPGTLPFTGSHTPALTGTGLGLLVGGAVMTATGRRRRTR